MTLSASGEPVPSSDLALRAHHLDPSFLWIPPAARAAVVAWTRDAYMAQHACSINPFQRLPEDCAGDVLEFFGMAMTCSDALHIAKHCSSPEARAWLRAVVAAAVVVGSMNCFDCFEKVQSVRGFSRLKRYHYLLKFDSFLYHSG